MKKAMKVTSKEFITKVQEVEERLVSKLDLKGKRQSTVERMKSEAHMEAVFLALRELVDSGEDIKAGDVTFYKKLQKGRETKKERTVVMHKGTDKERTMVIPAGKSPDRNVLALKGKIEF